LTESAVAHELEFSRTPVREAFRLLEHDGLLERRAGLGLIAADLDREQLDDIYTTRSVLHGLAARLAALRMTPREHLTLWALHDEMVELTAGKALRSLAAVNLRFHDEIVRGSRSPSLARLLGDVEGLIVRFRHASVVHSDRLEQANEEHRQIVRCIEARDESGAEEAAREHVLNAFYVRLKADVASELARLRDELDDAH
jgi:DNA-binding GntR family transcriptional regulator